MKREKDFTSWLEDTREKKSEFLAVSKAQQEARKDLIKERKKWQFSKNN